MAKVHLFCLIIKFPKLFCWKKQYLKAHLHLCTSDIFLRIVVVILCQFYDRWFDILLFNKFGAHFSMLIFFFAENIFYAFLNSCLHLIQSKPQNCCIHKHEHNVYASFITHFDINEKNWYFIPTEYNDGGVLPQMFIKIKIGDMTTLISNEITSRKYTPLACIV